MFCDPCHIDIFLYRDQAFIARTQLAILDYNAHAKRDKYRNKDGNEVFHCKYRKASQMWDTTPAIKKKEYLYISKLMDDILDYRIQSHRNMKFIPPVAADHPSQIQKTISHSDPIPTHQIVQRKQSHF